MSAITAAPAQFKQPSRKGKKAWRKNVDITEIQSGLENVREEIIAGGIIAEKPSSELFTIDSTGSTDILNKYLKTQKPLKADEILAQRSAIPALDSRKRPAQRVTDGVIEPSGKRRREGGVSHKEYEKLRQLAYGGESVHKNVVKYDAVASHDPWALEEKPQDSTFSFLEKKQPITEPKTLKHAPISLTASGKPIPAVKKPEAGKSYNPTFEDWDAIITREGNKEIEAEKRRIKEVAEEREREERIAAAAAEADREQQQDYDTDWESEWEGFQSEAEQESLKKKRPQRKTPAERNKIKRRKEAERKALGEAKQKAKDLQAAHIKALAKAIEEKEAAKASQAPAVDAESSSDEEDGNEVLRRRALGKIHVPEAPFEVVLADELADSLRRLKPEGNLLKDRFRNMLIRGKMETRRPVWQRKKAKTTVTEKWSYKDWKLN